MTTSSPRSRATPRSLIASWRRLKPFMGLSGWRTAILVVASVLAGLCEAAVLAVVVQIASAMSAKEAVVPISLGPLSALGTVPLGTLFTIAFVLAASRLVLQVVTAYLPAKISADVQARIRTDLYEAFSDADWSMQSRERDGRLQDVMTNQTYRATNAVKVFSNGISYLFNFSALIASAFVVHLPAAILVMTAAVLLFFALRPISRITRRLSQTASKASIGFAEGVTNSVRMAEEIQVHGVGEPLKNEMGELNEALRQPFFRSQLASGVLPPLYQGVTILLVVGGLLTLHLMGTGSLASLGAVVLILVRALTYSQALQGIYHSLNEQMPYVDLVRETLHEYRSHARSSGEAPITTVESLEMVGVGYAYVEGRPVLRDVSFRVERGESIGIVGPSGAGKSTLVQLLLRLRDPIRGTYCLNEQPAKTYCLRDWYAQVAYVGQDYRILNATVSENIRFFRPALSVSDIERAARLAHVHDEIMSWPQGYETPIGQRSDAVSGGQRQRLCLARALAGRPSVLILDEPTSALDVNSERMIQESLLGLRGQVTLFIVAHRLSTLNICDRIMVINDGLLEAFDTPTALMAKNEFFSHAVKLSAVTGDGPNS